MYFTRDHEILEQEIQMDEQGGILIRFGGNQVGDFATISGGSETCEKVTERLVTGEQAHGNVRSRSCIRMFSVL